MNTISNQYDCLPTVPEAARLVHLATGSLYHLVSEKRVPVIRISARCIRFSRTSLLLWLDGLTQAAVQPERSAPALSPTRRDRMIKNRLTEKHRVRSTE